ncbi:MAG: MarR family transcriptional regulator [Eubacteriales bacterium]|nr:MarR family transcriptional regulator [Eubacteriales bacterium]
MLQFQKMDHAYDAYAKARNMNYLSLMVLEEIYELGDGCTQKQISEDIHYPKQAVNLVVRTLLEEDLVELKELPENRKNKGITLTSRGRQRCRETVAPLLSRENRAMNRMSPEERQEMLRLLTRYAAAYCEEMARPE